MKVNVVGAVVLRVAESGVTVTGLVLVFTRFRVRPVLCVTPPPVAVTVSGYVPAAADPAWIVKSVAPLAPATGFWLNV